MIVFTIGHSNLPLGSFIELLKQHAISTVADVRSQPFSSYNPQFNQNNLANHLELNHINYKSLGNKLGGHPRNRTLYYLKGSPDYSRIEQSQLYQQGISELIQIVREKKVAIMCSESNFRECHRYHLIAKTLVLHGIEVKHIQSDGSLCDNPPVQLSMEV